ncbi:hypothetical protein ACFWIO_02700 [Streptomyces diastatochromogenes]
MSEHPDFEERLFLEGQAVYQRIVDGQVSDVEAELMDAHLRASEEGEDA